MAQPRDYHVKLYPAHKRNGTAVTICEIYSDRPYPETRVTAAGMDDLVD